MAPGVYDSAGGSSWQRTWRPSAARVNPAALKMAAWSASESAASTDGAVIGPARIQATAAAA